MRERAKTPGPVQIGDWTLVTELNLLRRAGKEVRLEPRHADLLLFLSAHRGEVVRTEDIIHGVWDGQVVTDHSVYQAIAKLRKAVGDSASRPHYIETAPKRGYRLIADVSEVPEENRRDASGGPTPGTPQPDVEASQIGAAIRGKWLSVTLVLMTMLLGVWWLYLKPVNGPAHTYRTVAVLPFAALSERESYRHVAEGFSIELADALGHSTQARVIGPISVMLAATLGESLPEIGRQLHADIVVNGTIRRLKDKLSVSSTLTDVESGHQLWSEVFDRHSADILAIQREVANAVAG